MYLLETSKMWLAKVLMFAVTGFIGYWITRAVNREHIGQMIAVVTVLIILHATIQDLTPVFKQWQARYDRIQGTLDRIGGNDTWNMPVQGRITKYFGKDHHGIDIACNEYTPIRAERMGIVTAAGWHDVYGNYIVVDYGGGISWLYGHCNDLYFKKGQTVLKGEKICLTGSSGRSTGPHLHLEIRVSGVAVDPLSYLR